MDLAGDAAGPMKITGIDQVKLASKRVQAITDIATRAGYRAVNAVAEKVKTQAVRDIVGQLNLSHSYVSGLAGIIKASPGDEYRSASSIAYVRMRMRAIRLARFDARIVTADAPRAKGDYLRNIGAGRKAVGVSVKVTRRGQRKTMPGAFLLPLRAGKIDGGNGMGVFVRRGSRAHAAALNMDFSDIDNPRRPRYSTRRREYAGQLVHLYGPSPDQIFRRWRAEYAPDILRMLVKAYDSQLRYELRGSRK